MSDEGLRPRPLSGSYYFSSRPFQELSEHSRRSWRAGHVATLVLGADMTGAHEACRRVGTMLANEMNAEFVAVSTRAPTVSVDQRGLLMVGVRTEAQFMSGLLSSWGLRLSSTSDKHLRERVCRTIAVAAHETCDGRVCVLVDLRTPDRLSDIVHLDALEKGLGDAGCTSHFILLFAHLDEEERRQLDGAKASPTLRAMGTKWLARPFRWPELAIDSVPAFIAMYDQTRRKGEGGVLSEVFAPAWWRQGWRFESMGRVLVNALHETAQSAGIGRCTAVPMGILVGIAENALLTAASGKSPDVVLKQAVFDSPLRSYWRTR